jgi:hypothetical protein
VVIFPVDIIDDSPLLTNNEVVFVCCCCCLLMMFMFIFQNDGMCRRERENTHNINVQNC